MLLFLAFCNFLFFYLLTLKGDSFFKVTLAFIFVVVSFLFKMQIDVSNMPDYGAYYKVIGLVEPEMSLKILLTEPYYFQWVNYLYKNNSAEYSINFFYNVNFFLTVIFFVWLAFLNDISSWKKMILFSLYFHLFSFVLLRNTVPYILVGFLFYYLHKGKYIKISLLSFMAHLSSLPILIFAIFKNKSGDKKLIFIGFLFFFIFNIMLQLPLFGIYEKFSAYQEGDEYGKSLFHKIYFIIFLLGHGYLFFKDKSLYFNYTYTLVFLTYLVLQFASPVMGFRFSIYLIIYLMLNPQLKFRFNTERNLNLFSLSLIFLFLFNYMSIFL